MERRLAAILAADVVGYSRLMGDDEEGTLVRLKAHRDEVADPAIAKHKGRVVKLMGDGMLAEFASVVDAVRCAVDIQEAMREHSADLPKDQRIQLRIGINLGDVIVEDDDIYGDGVNIAARLEGLAEAGGVCVSGTVFNHVHNKVDLAFDDLGERRLKNITGPVRVYRVLLREPDAFSGLTMPKALPLPDKASIAVLPFVSISGDVEEVYFADGLVDDIITTLSKLSGLHVIAQNSSAVFKGRETDPRQAGGNLGVRYVLTGSVQIIGKRIRINTQFINVSSGFTIWAERYRHGIDDIFAIQDEITLKLATEMQVQLTEGEQARMQYTTTNNVEAWTNWVKGLSHYRGAVTKDGMGRAKEFWEIAISLDPDSAPLHAMLGFLHYVDARFGWWDDRETAIRKGASYVERALKLDPDNADARRASSFGLLLRRHHDEAVVEARRALNMAPGSADIASSASFVFCCSGLAEEALAQIERAMRLHPKYPALYLGHLGNAYRHCKRFDEAIAAFKSYNDRSPGFGLADLVIIYQETDRPEEAASQATHLLAVRPNFTVRSWADTQLLSDPAQLQADMDALRNAALPE